jgi:hypothetical protein
MFPSGVPLAPAALLLACGTKLEGVHFTLQFSRPRLIQKLCTAALDPYCAKWFRRNAGRPSAVRTTTTCAPVADLPRSTVKRSAGVGCCLIDLHGSLCSGNLTARDQPSTCALRWSGPAPERRSPHLAWRGLRTLSDSGSMHDDDRFAMAKHAGFILKQDTVRSSGQLAGGEDELR